MPIAAKKSPYLDRLQGIDPTVICVDEAVKRSVRELHIGIINMMPDSALRKTEEQFTLPLHYASGGLQIVPHFIALDGVERQNTTQQYVEDNYITFDQAKDEGLDGLIITGANFAGQSLKEAPFYNPLKAVIDWAESENGPTSTLYSCMASHAYMSIKYDEERERLPEKRWGVFEHKVRNERHPLTHGMDTVFDIPHSRWNQVNENQFRAHNMPVLVASDEAGVHMATSPDGLRAILWQGHPEYNTNTLLTEWQRDFGTQAAKRLNGETVKLPPFPQGYLTDKTKPLLEEFREKVLSGHFDNALRSEQGLKLPKDTYKEVLDNTPNRWSSSRRALLSNWVAAILDKTHEQRGKPFMDGVDRDNVFNLPENDFT